MKMENNRFGIFKIFFKTKCAITASHPYISFIIRSDMTYTIKTVIRETFQIVPGTYEHIFPFGSFLNIIQPSTESRHPDASMLVFVQPVNTVMAQAIDIILIILEPGELKMRPLLLCQNNPVSFGSNPNVSLGILHDMVRDSTQRSARFGYNPLLSQNPLIIQIGRINFNLAVPFPHPDAMFTIFKQRTHRIGIQVIAMPRTGINMKLASKKCNLLQPF